MEDPTKPVAVSSEQLAAPTAEPSQQSQTVEPTVPVETATPEPKQEPKQKEDPDAVLRKVREQARHDLESEYGKRQSEAIRQVQERAAAERDTLLTQLGQFVPDDELAKARQTIQERGLREQLAYYQQKDAQDGAMRQLQGLAMRNLELVKKAGYDGFDKIPKDVLGTTAEDAATFPERFADHLATKYRDALADADKREKKAREEGERETEKRLGVPKMSGATPSGSGGSTLEGLQRQLRDAHARNDGAAIDRLGREIEEAVYRR